MEVLNKNDYVYYTIDHLNIKEGYVLSDDGEYIVIGIGPNKRVGETVFSDNDYVCKDKTTLIRQLQDDRRRQIEKLQAEIKRFEEQLS